MQVKIKIPRSPIISPQLENQVSSLVGATAALPFEEQVMRASFRKFCTGGVDKTEGKPEVPAERKGELIRASEEPHHLVAEVRSARLFARCCCARSQLLLGLHIDAFRTRELFTPGFGSPAFHRRLHLLALLLRRFQDQQVQLNSFIAACA